MHLARLVIPAIALAAIVGLPTIAQNADQADNAIYSVSVGSSALAQAANRDRDDRVDDRRDRVDDRIDDRREDARRDARRAARRTVRRINRRHAY